MYVNENGRGSQGRGRLNGSSLGPQCWSSTASRGAAGGLAVVMTTRPESADKTAAGGGDAVGGVGFTQRIGPEGAPAAEIKVHRVRVSQYRRIRLDDVF